MTPVAGSENLRWMAKARRLALAALKRMEAARRLFAEKEAREAMILDGEAAKEP